MRLRKIIGMMISLACLIFGCKQNPDYKLPERVEEIKQLKYFDNSIVVLGEYYDSINENSAMIPYWKPEIQFYEGDRTRFLRGIGYEALVENKGMNPLTSPSAWQPIYEPHPYLFFRDSVSIGNLKKMVRSDNVYLKMYAFAALRHHNEDGLLDIIYENLNDTTKVDYFTADVGYRGYPVDLMIEWKLKDLTPDQVQSLITLLTQKYPYLERSKEMLLENEIVY
ncbi:hypothetical protein BH09BAC3_BH09BAC3_09220 [soil metagenome]